MFRRTDEPHMFVLTSSTLVSAIILYTITRGSLIRPTGFMFLIIILGLLWIGISLFAEHLGWWLGSK